MPSFAESHVTRLETLIAANVGVQSVTIDGVSVNYDDLLKQYQFWQKRLAIETGTRPRVAQVDLTVGVSLKLKDFFFDRLEVQKQVGIRRTKFLGAAGAYGQKVAKRSMRRVGKKGKPSNPGQPPRYHGIDPALRTILFGYDPSTGGMVIGPLRFNQKHYLGSVLTAGTIPQLHEEGGKLGIREKMVGTEWRPVGRRKPRPGQPTRVRIATYPARPFMGPAQAKTISKFPSLFFGRAA